MGMSYLSRNNQKKKAPSKKSSIRRSLGRGIFLPRGSTQISDFKIKARRFIPVRRYSARAMPRVPPWRDLRGQRLVSPSYRSFKYILHFLDEGCQIDALVHMIVST